VESREKGKLGQMEFRITWHYNGRNCQELEVCEDQKYHFQAIVIDCLACTEAKWCCSNKSVALVLYCLGDQGGGRGECIPVDASNVEWEVPIMY
jgi:hypothetical protein